MNGDRYWHRVAAVDTSGNISGVSPRLSTIPFDRNPPGRPYGVWAQPGIGLSEIEVYWTPVLDEDAIGYGVFRVDSGGNEVALCDVNVDGIPLCAGGPTLQSMQVTSVDAAGTSPLAHDTLYEFVVRSYDSSLNSSEASAIVSARTRSDAIDPPLLQSTEFTIDWGCAANETEPCYGGDAGCISGLLAPGDPEYDQVAVRLTWERSTSLVTDYKIYRRGDGDPTWLHLDTIADDGGSGPTMTYLDPWPPCFSCEYYVTALESLSGEESAAERAPSVGPTTDPIDAAHAFVWTLSAEDGRYDWALDDDLDYDDLDSVIASQKVRLIWTPTLENEVVGYHVYRACNWFQCDSGTGSYTTAYDGCNHSWVRLTEAPIAEHEFTDNTVGGVPLCLSYAVRPAFRDGSLGTVRRVATVGTSIVSSSNIPLSCTSELLYLWPYYRVANQLDQTWDSIARMNAHLDDRGTGAPDGPPAAPQGVAWFGYSRYETLPDPPTAEITSEPIDIVGDLSSISWLPNQESDISGYHVEIATAPWRSLATPIAAPGGLVGHRLEPSDIRRPTGRAAALHRRWADCRWG